MLVDECERVVRRVSKYMMEGRRSVAAIGVLWAQYGPYHCARIKALKELAGPGRIHALEIANQTTIYNWDRSREAEDLVTLFPGYATEEVPFALAFRRARREFARLKLDVCLLPSYSPKQSLAAFLAAKSLGIRTVMMNDTHEGTGRTRGLKAILKRRLVSGFQAALVAGAPHVRYLTALGMAEGKIFTGYDAVDNDYFATKAAEARARELELRKKYQLPKLFFLSLGRLVAKKNLAVMIQAYRKVVDSSANCSPHLVLVGSGDEETKLRSFCRKLRLPVYDKSSAGGDDVQSKSEAEPPGVHFYGFRQIEESPVFYALAAAFILPSLQEEWGLVVNEAMASGLPVVVSETAGCAEDLMRWGSPVLMKMPVRRLPRQQSDMTDRFRQNGFVFDPRSLESLAEVMLALASAPALRELMGKNSQAIIEDFSCAVFARNALLAAESANGEDALPPLFDRRHQHLLSSPS